MSTSTTPEPSPPGTLRLGQPVETAPSATIQEGPTFARMVGFGGLFLLVLGTVVVVATRATGRERMISEGWAFLIGALGIALMLYHATSDGDQEVRRMYGGFGLFWMVFAVVAGTVPGPVFDSGIPWKDRTVGLNLLPWGVGAGFLGLLFFIPFCRYETDEGYRTLASGGLLIVGAALAVGSVVAGIFKPDFLAGPGLGLALLGLAFLCAYLSIVDTSDGPGFNVAVGLGILGAALIVYAIFRASFPTLLYEGPSVLRKPDRSLDWWKTSFRVLAGVAFLLPAAIALMTRAPRWMHASLTTLGLIGAGVVVTSLFSKPVTAAPATFLVPGGLILIVIGLVYLTIALGVCAENQFVTLTRRELSSYFLSPIGYLVMAGMAMVQWIGYYFFVLGMAQDAAAQAGQPIPEPIVRSYYNLLMLFALMFQVPVLTMRLVAEERRSGSLEVLLTAPVNEWLVILSKFLATWIFFLLTWLPTGLYLIALRLEVGAPFDYRPLLSFYLCLMAQGLAFVGMGLFFSTVTRNQIVAAVLAFVGMMFFLICFILRRQQTIDWIPPFLQTAFGRLSFYDMWIESLAGRLPLRDVLLFSSLGIFWVFLSVKVLETRRWS